MSPDEMETLFRLLVKIRVEAGDFSSGRKDQVTLAPTGLAEKAPSA